MNLHRIVPSALLLTFFFVSECRADYPIFYQRYTADPWCIEHNGRIYMYCSHDTFDPERGYGYFMNDVTLISTSDLKNWTDHGEVFSAADSRWGAHNTWAPSVVERNGKFYLYYGDANGGGIGVAVSDTPMGAFRDTLSAPLVGMNTPGVTVAADGTPLRPRAGLEGALSGAENWGMWCFDPCAFVDDDGQAYLYFGGAHPDNSRVVKLKENMTELDGPVLRPETAGFFEASAVHKYKGTYYYSYSSHGHRVPCTIDYVTSKNPMKGFSNARIAMEQPPANDGYNHHQCIFEFQGQWYMAYHNRQLAYENNESDRRGREYQRSVALDRLYYDEKGNIIPVQATRDGLPQLHTVDPTARNEAETMARSHGIEVKGGRVLPREEGAFVRIRGVEFKQAASRFTAALACNNPGGGIVEVHLESPAGLLAGVLAVEPTGARNVVTDGTSLQEGRVSIDSGIYDIYLVFRGNTCGQLALDWWKIQ